MPVALVDFEAMYDGELVSFSKGEVFADQHEMVRRHPEIFGLIPAPPSSRRKRRLASARRSSVNVSAPRRGPVAAPVLAGPSLSDADREVPELRADAKPTLTVKLSSFGRRSIDQELSYSRDLLEDYDAETGGYLFGSRDGGTWLLSATRLGSSGRRKPQAVQLGYDEAERMAHDIRSSESDHRFLGRWHTHPYVNNSQPSTNDRANALAGLAWRDLNPASFAVDLILTPDRERGWSRPHFHAWVTRRNQCGTAVTEPATLND
jgi:hypothetical protein